MIRLNTFERIVGFTVPSTIYPFIIDNNIVQLGFETIWMCMSSYFTYFILKFRI